MHNLWAKILDSVGGSLVGSTVNTIKEYFPPSMTEKEKVELELKLSNALHSRELDMLKATTDMEVEYNQRIKDMEGTASDLLALPFIGRVIIFLRGMQRPLWGVGTMVLDYQVFSGAWKIQEGSQYGTVFWIINLLVLGFLFGERAIKNVSPLIERLLTAKGIK